LTVSRRSEVLDRENLEEIAREAQFSGKRAQIKGADFTITGDVVEFGRKETGDSQLFGSPAGRRTACGLRLQAGHPL